MIDTDDESRLYEALTAFYVAENERHGGGLHPDHLVTYSSIGEDHHNEYDAWFRYVAESGDRPNLPDIVARIGHHETLRIVRDWATDNRTPRSHEIPQDAEFGDSWADGAWDVKMPPEVLSASIAEAAEDVDVCGPAALERHPAVLTLCNWWNANAHKEQRAASASILVRPRSTESTLQDAAGEAPSIADVALLKQFHDAIAFVAPATLIMFFEPQDVARSRSLTNLPDEPDGQSDWLLRKTVTGDYWDATWSFAEDYQRGEFDTAYETLRALRLYPRLFPVAFAALNAKEPASAYGADPWGQHIV
jgi:hypothetical protein